MKKITYSQLAKLIQQNVYNFENDNLLEIEKKGIKIYSKLGAFIVNADEIFTFTHVFYGIQSFVQFDKEKNLPYIYIF